MIIASHPWLPCNNRWVILERERSVNEIGKRV
jgi:hypothetical protein